MSINKTFVQIGRTISKHSPIILTTTGVIGMGATAYFTYKNAPKIKEIVDETRMLIAQEEVVDNVKVAKEMVKAMAVPVGLGVASIGCFIWSYSIQAGRIAALSGAFAAATEEINRVRAAYLEKHGEKKFNEFFNPEKDRVVITTDKDGKEKETTEKVAEDIGLMTGVWFSGSEEYFKDAHDYNEEWVKSKIEQLEMKMFQRGSLLMNEVLDTLGFERTRMGALLGWGVNAGFQTQVFHLYDEELDQRIPQIFIRWNTPKYVYETVEFEDAKYYI